MCLDRTICRPTRKQRETKDFALALIKMSKVLLDLRGRLDFKPIRDCGHEALDGVGCSRRPQLPVDSRGAHNSAEQFWKDVLEFDENEVVERRRIGNDDH